MNLVSSLAACANSLVDSIQLYVMFMITNLIVPRMGKLILNNLIGNSNQEFRNGFLDSYLFQLTLGSNYLELCF